MRECGLVHRLCSIDKSCAIVSHVKRGFNSLIHNACVDGINSRPASGELSTRLGVEGLPLSKADNCLGTNLGRVTGSDHPYLSTE